MNNRAWVDAVGNLMAVNHHILQSLNGLCWHAVLPRPHEMHVGQTQAVTNQLLDVVLVWCMKASKLPRYVRIERWPRRSKWRPWWTECEYRFAHEFLNIGLPRRDTHDDDRAVQRGEPVLPPGIPGPEFRVRIVQFFRIEQQLLEVNSKCI